MATTSLRNSWLSRLLVLSGLAWVGWLLMNGAADLEPASLLKNWPWLVTSLALGALSVYHCAPVFHILLNANLKGPVPLSYSTKLFFFGQVARHLPGRFWGVLYQINETRSNMPALLLIKVNVDYTLFFLSFNLLAAVTVTVFRLYHPAMALVLLLGGLIVITAALHFDWFHVLLSHVQRFFPKPVRQRIQAYLDSHDHSYSTSNIAKLLLISSSSWFFYLAAWACFPFIYPALKETDVFVLCATYTIAWAIGFVSMIVPAGLGVREAAFVLLSTPLADTGELAFAAIFVRIWLLLIDLAIFAVTWLFITTTRGKPNAPPSRI